MTSSGRTDFPQKFRRALVRVADSLSRRFAQDRTVVTLEGGVLSFDDYQYRPKPRFGEAVPPLHWLVALLQEQSDHLAASLNICATFTDDLARITMAAPNGSPDPTWNNVWMSGLDAAWLYSVVRDRAPALFVEIGSGNSTKFVRRGIEDGNLKTKMVSIDPYPRTEIDELCDAVYRTPLESTDFAVFEAIAPGDILFFDGSHRALQNSDVTVFFLEILPRLPGGVLIGIHDIFLPFDYPHGWTKRLYSEQYLLGAYLIGGRNVVIDFAAYWMSRTDRFAKQTDTVFRFDAGRQIQRHGGCFFFRS